jgi:hypothetical protein
VTDIASPPHAATEPASPPVTVARVRPTLMIENDLVSALVAVDRGADLISLVFRPRNLDVLWKPGRAGQLPNGLEPTEGEWHAGYPGGWQTILPNFGPPNRYDGRWLGMHGEAACVPWTIDEIGQSHGIAALTASTTPHSVPLRVSRTLSLRAGEPVLRITEAVTNLSNQPIACMWGHHPAFGPPFLSPHCIIDTSARTVEPDAGYRNPSCDLAGGARTAWPCAQTKSGMTVDLSRPPPPGAGVSRVVTLSGFADPWYAITNVELGVGVGLAWTADPFPYACLWQESDGSADAAFGAGPYALAIEPHSSYPGHGLAAVARSTGTQLTFAPSERRTVRLCVTFFQGTGRVTAVGLDGEVARA